VQLSLQTLSTPIPHGQAVSDPQTGWTDDAYTCSCRFRPNGCLRYEHMFPSPHTSPFAKRVVSALLWTRSFLLLEDDYEVDWEVDRDELGHPHRASLGSRLGDRRPGAVTPREMACLCPVAQRERRGGETGGRGSRMSTGIARVAIDR
jgi:hypothetical protein